MTSVKNIVTKAYKVLSYFKFVNYSKKSNEDWCKNEQKKYLKSTFLNHIWQLLKKFLT